VIELEIETRRSLDKLDHRLCDGGMRHAAVILTVGGLLLAGCTSTAPEPNGRPAPVPTTTPTATTFPVEPSGETSVIASDLRAPWSIVRLESGSTLISERDSATVKELQADGAVREVGTIEDVVPGGEGGLLGLAVRGDELFAYFTAAADNRIVRMGLEGRPGAYRLGASVDVLTGLAKARNHNGGRIAFGPDGMLYATVGDAGEPDRAQDPRSLNGKILRIDPDGGVPTDNPTPGSLVYSMGHRNPQGIAWDAEGRLWAAEFGQDTWDELNLIEPGGNYGWPIVEGIGGNPSFTDPVYQWPTDDASPSGLAVVDGTLFLAGLGGQRLWVVQPGNTTVATEWFTGEFGRLRDAAAGPDGSLWMLTNNTDGRGNPRAGDDRLIQVELVPLG
jgi:glucose/arabinose dehydrogenase